jgi:hypothetical protein
MEVAGTIASRIIQYLGIKGVTQEEFAEDFRNGKTFDKGRLGKAKQKDASIGSDVVEKFLRRFPEVNPYWLILGKGEVNNERLLYDEPVKVMPLDTWQELQRNNHEFRITHASDLKEKEKYIDQNGKLIDQNGQMLEFVLNFARGSVGPHKS